MPLQNRVTPEGSMIATAGRGLLMGNRGGMLHRRDKTLGTRRWVGNRWICCRLSFKDRRRFVMAPGSYTELFFLDEATALAAGHRPCFECRQEDAIAFAVAWNRARGLPGRARAAEIDSTLHIERVGEARSKRVFQARIEALPDGAFVRLDGQCHLLLRRNLLAWTPAGYSASRPAPGQRSADVLTPAGIIAVLKSGYRPLLHATATDLG